MSAWRPRVRAVAPFRTLNLTSHCLRSSVKVAGKDPKAAADLLPATFSIIDRSAKTGLIKKNTAARYKSRLHVRVKALA